MIKLIDANALVNKAKSTDGATPLFIAARNGHHTVVAKLIGAGALVDKATTIYGETPLYTAAFYGRLAVVTMLLAAGALVDHLNLHAMAPCGNTALYIAAEKGHTAIVSILLQHSADKSIPGNHNRTPLLQARIMNQPAVVALLV